MSPLLSKNDRSYGSNNPDRSYNVKSDVGFDNILPKPWTSSRFISFVVQWFPPPNTLENLLTIGIGLIP